jgi:hypothetical protein
LLQNTPTTGRTPDRDLIDNQVRSRFSRLRYRAKRFKFDQIRKTPE